MWNRTHRAIGPLACQHVAIDACNHRVGIYRKFGLNWTSLATSGKTDRTYIEDVKDPIEVQLPGSDRLFVVLCVKESRDRISFTLLDDLPLNLADSPVIERSVGRPLDVCMVVAAHVVNRSIAPRTDWLSSSSCFPFNPRSRAWQTSAQDKPSSTQSCLLIIDSWGRVSRGA